MNIKRYIAEDVSEAVEKIREELGRDAFILNTRKIRRKGLTGFFRKPLVEVVAAYENEEKKIVRNNLPNPFLPSGQGKTWEAPPAIQPARQQLPGQNAYDQLLLQSKEGEPELKRFSELEEKIDSIALSLNNMAGRMQLAKNDFRNNYVTEVEKLVLSLVENEVHQEFVHKIAKEVNDIVLRSGADANEVMEQILRQYLGDAVPIKQKKFQRSVVLFVGPTGVGKTTSLAKLAAIYSINHHAKVGMITTDTYRIGAVEQLKTYAEILEIPLGVVYEPSEIADVLKQFEDKDIVMIDTAGKSPNDRSQESEISELIKYAAVDEVYLVMSMTTGFAGCINITNNYSFLNDYKIIITKMDESPTWGMLLNLKFLTDKPLSYMAAGQAVPDDIEVANAKKVIDRLMGRDTI